MGFIEAPKPILDQAGQEEAVAAFIGQAKAATPAQRAQVLARLRRMVASNFECPVYKGHTVPLAAVQRVVEGIEAL